MTIQLCGARANHIKHFQRDIRATVSRLVQAEVNLVISSVALPSTLRQALR